MKCHPPRIVPNPSNAQVVGSGTVSMVSVQPVTWLISPEEMSARNSDQLPLTFKPSKVVLSVPPAEL